MCLWYVGGSITVSSDYPIFRSGKFKVVNPVEKFF